MSDDIKREDAIARILACERVPGTDQQIKVVDAYDAIRTLPAAPVREVVTCGECVYWQQCSRERGFCDEIWNGEWTNRDDFCSYGKRADMRKEEDEAT